jgi:hypothetical protein
VKEVTVNGTRYIVCKNERQARKDAASRQAILDSLWEKLKTTPKSLDGNKCYRSFLRIDKETVTIDENKVALDARFDGILVLTTNESVSESGSAERQGVLDTTGRTGHESRRQDGMCRRLRQGVQGR